MIVDDSFNYHARLNTKLSFTIINYHQLSCSLDMFKFDVIVHDSFVCLTERMIVHDSFLVSGGNQGGLNTMATALPSSCEEQQSDDLDEYSDNSDAQSEKVRKAKKINLIDENEAQPWLWKNFCDDYRNRDVTGNNTALKFNVREGITSVSKKILRSDASTLPDFDKLS